MSISSGNPTKIINAQITDASAARYRLIVFDTNTTALIFKAKKAAAATAPFLGVLAEATTAADTNAPIVVEGIALLEVDGSGTAITTGCSITSNASAIGIKTTTGGNYAIGYAMAPSTAAGDLIPVLIARHIVPS